MARRVVPRVGRGGCARLRVWDRQGRCATVHTGSPLHQGLGSLVCSGLETPARDVEGLYMAGWPLVAGFLDPGVR